MKWAQSALHQNVREHRGNQLCAAYLRRTGQRHPPLRVAGRALLVRSSSIGRERPLQPPHAVVRIECQNQQIPERARTLQQPYVARMKNVIAAVGEHHRLSGRLPSARLATGLRGNKNAHSTSAYTLRVAGQFLRKRRSAPSAATRRRRIRTGIPRHAR